MDFNIARIIRSALCLSTLMLAACGGSSGGGAAPGASYVQMGGALQGGALKLTPTVSDLAGSPPGTDATGNAARFMYPTSVVADGANLYVADMGTNRIRKILIATGVVTTLAGTGESGASDGPSATATFSMPKGITSDGTYLYVIDSGNNKIRRISIATGDVSSLTGTANTKSAEGAIDGTSALATFKQAFGITTDGNNLYVADSGNNKIRKIAISTGDVSSLTGVANSEGVPGAKDGIAATATFASPIGITSIGANLYVADMNNHKIRKVDIASGAVSSETGVVDTSGTHGAKDGVVSGATFNSPYGITTDGGNLFVMDSGNLKVRMISVGAGMVSSVTGVTDTPSSPGATDGAGAVATFKLPSGVTIAGGSLYVTDAYGNTIRSIALSTADVATLAGTALTSAEGSGAEAIFSYPTGIATDGTNLFVADYYNNAIRKVVIATGQVTTLAGTGMSGAADGPGTTATFKYPASVTTDGSNVYVADTGNNKIRKIVINTGAVSSFTGVANTTVAAGADDGAGTAASFKQPQAITTDGTNLYVADTGNRKIRKIVIASGEVSSVTGAANTAGGVGAADGVSATATFNWPAGITTDGTNLYVSDQTNNKIRKVVIATGMVSSITGAENTLATPGATDGAAATASFSSPAGITTDGVHLYVADTSNNKMRKIEMATGIVSSITGVTDTAAVAGSSNGAGSAAKFTWPVGITTDGKSLFVTDTYNNTIRKIQ